MQKKFRESAAQARFQYILNQRKQLPTRRYKPSFRPNPAKSVQPPSFPSQELHLYIRKTKKRTTRKEPEDVPSIYHRPTSQAQRIPNRSKPKPSTTISNHHPPRSHAMPIDTQNLVRSRGGSTGARAVQSDTVRSQGN